MNLPNATSHSATGKRAAYAESMTSVARFEFMVSRCEAFMVTHELKTDPFVFDAVESGIKLFQIRKDDRSYAVGDVLRLRRTLYSGVEMKAGAQLEYVGGYIDAKVTFILRGPVYGLADGWVIMSIELVDHQSIA